VGKKPAMDTQNAVVRAALAGAATGARSFTGLAVLALDTPGTATGQPDATLRHGWVQALMSAGAAGELVADKLPQAPSRTAPPGLVSRLAAAAGVGFIVIRRSGPDRSAPGGVDASPSEASGTQPGPAAAAVAAAVGAAVSTMWLGTRWRQLAASWFGDDLPGAVLEDAWALTLAWAAIR